MGVLPIALSIACAPRVGLESPELGESLSLVLGQEVDGVPTGVVLAGRATPDEPFDLPAFFSGGDTRFTAVGFRCSLDTLGLEAGVELISGSEIEEDRALRLPPTHVALQTQIVDDQPSGWSEVPADDPVVRLFLSHVELEPARACGLYGVSYALEPIEGFDDKDPAIVLPLGDGEWLVSANDQEEQPETRIVRSDGSWQPVRLELPLPDGTSTTAPNAGGVIDEAGTIWLFSRDGRVAKGTLDAGFDLLATSGGIARDSDWFRADGRGSAQTFEAVSAQRGLVQHFDGSSWASIYDDLDAMSAASPIVASSGEGEAVVVQLEDDTAIFTVRRGAAPERSELPDLPSDLSGLSELPLGVSQSERWGLVLVSAVFQGFNPEAGFLFRRLDGQWTRVTNSRLPLAGQIVAEIAPGLFAISGRGDGERIGTYHEVAGACDSIQTPGDEDLEFIVGAGDDALVANDDGALWILRKKAMIDPCAEAR